MGRKKAEHRGFVRKHEGSRELGKPRCKWKDNIKVNLKVIVWKGLGWISPCKDGDKLWVV
jgi:hypothetical protein